MRLYGSKVEVARLPRNTAAWVKLIRTGGYIKVKTLIFAY